MSIAHGDPLVGHVGAYKVYAALKIVYQWPGLKDDVCKFVKQCQICLYYDMSTTKAPGLLQSLSITKLFETMAMDFVGGFHPTLEGHTHILISIDLFSKYVVAIPTKDMTSETVARFLLYQIVLCI